MFRLTGQLALLPYSFAEYQEMGLHQCPDLTVMGLRRSAENAGTVPRFLSGFPCSVAGNTLSSKTVRDLSPDTTIDAKGWFCQGETKPGR